VKSTATPRSQPYTAPAARGTAVMCLYLALFAALVPLTLWILYALSRR